MPLVHVAGWLRTRGRGRPDHGLPDNGNGNGNGEKPEHPDQGLPPIDEGAPDQGLPEPPPGVWPEPSVSHPIVPLPPGDETPPGTVWPSPGTPEHPIASQKFWIVAGIPGYGWRYVCVDPSLLIPSVSPH